MYQRINADGAIKVSSSYVQLRGRTYYYRRRIPADVRPCHPGKRGDLILSLKTGDYLEACKRADVETRRLNALWKAHREGAIEFSPQTMDAAMMLLRSYGLKPNQWREYEALGLAPDDFLDREVYEVTDDPSQPQRVRPDLGPVPRLAADLFHGKAKPVPFLSQALKQHQELRGEFAGSKEDKARRRTVGRFIAFAGDLPINQYSRDQANRFVRDLCEGGLKTRTIQRYVNYIGPVFSVCLREHEIEKPSPFRDIIIPRLGNDSSGKKPFTHAELRRAQALCRDTDDDLRWIVAIASDTGMRLAEVTGLRREDIKLTASIPHLTVRPNGARRLKTAGSTRMVPLVGAALWGASRALAAEGGEYLFPRYAGEGTNKATHASNTLAKWLKANVAKDGGKTMHSFRHSFRDRIRNVGGTEEHADRLGGWATKGVGQGYGEGHGLAFLAELAERIVIQELWGPIGGEGRLEAL